ncbi:ATP-binding protein [Campylobacter jejuni]|uniref:ATP-binding protein n=1 Tax=Campylobacter jejuni TaxID=197 RepID=UPI00111DE674|nr:ATP-binding protein [Campylobacter jejuni]
MIPNTNEIAKQTLIALKERKLKPTPENYTEIFEELSLKYGITSSNKAKLDKYKTLLLPIYQQELNSKTIRSLEELISFLISVLNRQSGKQFSEFFDFLYTISKTLQISKDKKIRDLAKVTSIRISKTMDSESIYLLTKKWKELERNYDENDLEEQARKYGISKYDDYDSVIKKLLVKLEERSYEHFSELLCLGLNPSLVEDLKIQGFIQNLTQKPFVIGEENFKNELMEFINHRINLVLSELFKFKEEFFYNKYFNFYSQISKIAYISSPTLDIDLIKLRAKKILPKALELGIFHVIFITLSSEDNFFEQGVKFEVISFDKFSLGF